MTGFTAEIFSGVAVLVSGYSLWQTSLRGPALRVFVPPLIRYSSPYSNSNFEIFEIPLTVTNEGARTGTVVTLDLEVTNVKTGAVKQFYSAGLGPWTLGKVRGEGLVPFTPFSLAGRNSQSETVLFYARENSPVMQVVEGPGLYTFALSLVTESRKPIKPMSFEMNLAFMDARAFTSGAGTLPMHHPDWQATAS